MSTITDAAKASKLCASCRHWDTEPYAESPHVRRCKRVPQWWSATTWDEDTFRAYIKDPRGKVPGTKMTFSGLTREKDIDDILAYLKGFGPDGKKLP